MTVQCIVIGRHRQVGRSDSHRFVIIALRRLPLRVRCVQVSHRLHTDDRLQTTHILYTATTRLASTIPLRQCSYEFTAPTEVWFRMIYLHSDGGNRNTSSKGPLCLMPLHFISNYNCVYFTGANLMHAP